MLGPPTVGFRQRTLDAGYFPQELPPPFNTQSFAHFAANNPTYIQNLWAPFANQPYITKLVRHHLAQAGKNRRILSIPNPINQLRLVQAIDQHFTQIFTAAGLSNISASKPHFNYSSPRAIWPQRNFETIPRAKAKARAVARYILKTDISRFFPSIYTHSIPWALHTKAVAKVNRGPALIGNVLDKILREMNDGQTVGIPIGPDTSLVIAELILGAVDSVACQNCSGFRWYDDYEISAATKGDCETQLVELERALLSYELELNASKTSITELPLPIEDQWVHVLREFSFRTSKTAQLKDLNQFFSLAFQYSEDGSRKSVLRYAVRKLHGAKVHVGNWEHVQRLIAQAASHEPEVLPHVLGCLNFYECTGYTIDRRLLEKLLSHICRKYAKRFVGSEVAWCIWGFLQFNIDIPQDCVSEAVKIEDDVVSLLLLDARRRGLVADKSSLSDLRLIVDGNAFEGDHWLLAYEGMKRGWIRPDPGNRAAFNANPHVQALRAADVNFYKRNWTVDATARHIYGTPGWLLYQLANVPDIDLVEDTVQQ